MNKYLRKKLWKDKNEIKISIFLFNSCVCVLHLIFFDRADSRVFGHKPTPQYVEPMDVVYNENNTFLCYQLN